MRNFFIKRSQFGWLYREQLTSGWNNFPDKVTDVKSMKDFFTDNGRMDSVSLSFVDNNHKPANFMEVHRKDGRFNAVLNGEKTIPLYDTDFVNYQDAIQFFQDRTNDTEVIERADMITMVLEKLQYYKKNADEQTAAEYKTLVSEKMSEENICSKLKSYYPDTQTEVYFI